MGSSCAMLPSPGEYIYSNIQETCVIIVVKEVVGLKESVVGK